MLTLGRNKGKYATVGTKHSPLWVDPGFLLVFCEFTQFLGTEAMPQKPRYEVSDPAEVQVFHSV
ncbi:MAG: hypothetical protein AAGJ40_03995 [Planctomycetota bacterium]